MKSVYFIGIGGIGMSALARYFLSEGWRVGGYDRTETPLTRQLQNEGAEIHYEDDPDAIGAEFRDPASTLVVYTPAVPGDHAELGFFRKGGFEVMKRSEILGRMSEGKYVMAVAGTHGKTTTTTMVAWLNHVAGGGGQAFLGGISKNFDSNLVLGGKGGRGNIGHIDSRGSKGNGDTSVKSGETGNVRFAVEADEFDRSFLTLHPDVAVITSADADHLDIYGTHANLLSAFGQFVGQIRRGGALIMHSGVKVPVDNPGITVYSYTYDGKADFHAANIAINADGTYTFDIVCPDRTVTDCRLGIPGKVNVENAIAAVAMLWAAWKAEVAAGKPTGFDDGRIREALSTFKGVKRRFDFHINTPELIYMDDYAHHPEELRAAITSVKEMFPGRRLTAVFQPHLYSRTNDFHREFASALSLADEVILLPVYPAREEPIEGVDSSMIASLVTVPHRIVPLERIAQEIERSDVDVLVSFGAGNIENYTGEIARRLQKMENDKR
jgi:UDP-N-acetylmuramate--alanine ligase